MLTDWECHWDSLRRLRGQMNRALEDQFFGAQFLPAYARSLTSFPKVNLFESPTHYVLTCELPGVSSDALDVSLAGRELTIKGQRPALEGTHRRYDRHERGIGAFNRTIELPGPVEPNAPNASLKHGVLTVELSKSPESLPRQIEIKTAERSAPRGGASGSKQIMRSRDDD